VPCSSYPRSSRASRWRRACGWCRPQGYRLNNKNKNSLNYTARVDARHLDTCTKIVQSSTGTRCKSKFCLFKQIAYFERNSAILSSPCSNWRAEFTTGT
jgi:hypothetical protein